MKKLLLTSAAWMTCFCVYAQNSPLPLSTVKERLKAANRHAPVKKQEVISGNELPLKNVNSTVVKPASQTTNLNSKSSSVPPEIIGTSTYDLQTNGSVQDRIYNAGGTLGATWTWSTDLAGTYPDRGPGYNYYDGTSWGPLPTTSITTDRRGWPNINRLANGGEVVISHANVTTTTAISSRSVAGTGTWTQTALPTFPGGEPTLWVRTAAGGPDGNTIHMIDISYPTGNGGALVNGLDGCLNYSRSLDGGVNWDIVRALPPNVNDQEYFGFRADGYAIDSKDNTVAFVSGDIADDWALWKSTDNGSNWTRTVIMDFPFTKYDDATQITDVDGDGVADTLLTTDGSYAIVLDQNGMVHAFAGAMLIIDDDPTGLLGLFLSTDGLFYWNENMGSNPPVVVATAPDLDGSGQADAFAADLGGRYGNDGICSMPSAGMDAAGNIYLSYCPLIEGTDSGNPSPLAFSFRNVYLKASSDGGATWTSGYNVSNSLFDEGVFNSVAKIVDNCVHMVYQQDGAPGYSVPPNGEHPIGNNDFIYDCVDVNLVLSSVNENLTPEVSVSLYPNPASDFVALNYTVTKAVDISVEVRNIMGQLVGTYTKKADGAGSHILSIDVSRFSSGMYTVNTILDNEVFSSRFVKN